MNYRNPIKIKDSIATKLLRIVFNLYILIAIAVTLGHMIMEYQYQKENIRNDLRGIQDMFEKEVAIDIWQLNEESLLSTLDGIIKIPVIVGVKIQNMKGMDLAVKGIISRGNSVGNVGQHVDLFGLSEETSAVHENEKYTLDIFSHQFPITYSYGKETKQLGKVTIYSNTSVIIRRVKLGFIMLIVNAVLKTAALWIIFLWFSNHLLRRPLAALADAAGEIDYNNLESFELKTSTSQDHNELTRLETSFKSMTEKLHQSVVEQTETRKALEDRQEQYRAVVDNVGDYIMRYDKEYRHIYANRKALEVTGLPVEDYIGRTHEEMGFPEHLCSLWKKNIRYVFDTGRQKNVGFDVELADGIMSLELQLNPEFASDGSIKSVIGIARDVTARNQAQKEKMKLETELQQSQKMESIGTLAGGIAHDFNNILFPIIGYSEMLLEEIPEDSQQRDSLNEIFNGALRARDLVKQILTFSRQESNEIKLLKIQPVVKEAMKLIRSTIPTTINIIQEISDDCGIIKADPTQIHQIVMNLATNAYHSMEESGGELRVALKETTIDEQGVIGLDIDPGDYVCLTIVDTGVGMEQEVLDKAFEPFFTTKEQGKGTGMGLAVIHGIVKKAGGNINVYSEPGKGTELQVYLPVVKSSAGQYKPEVQKIIQGGTEHILLVDDESAILKMEKQMLVRLGYQVVSCESSLQALELFRANPDKFDLVITDMAMPDMSGDKLSSELIKLRPDIPILLCTGFSERIPKEKTSAIGIRGFLMKPIVKGKLSGKIREILDD